MPLVPEDFFEKDDAAKEEAREGVEEPKEGRELKIARRRLTAAMRNFTVADFTPDRWTFDHNTTLCIGVIPVSADWLATKKT